MIGAAKGLVDGEPNHAITIKKDRGMCAKLYLVPLCRCCWVTVLTAPRSFVLRISTLLFSTFIYHTILSGFIITSTLLLRILSIVDRPLGV